MNENELWNQLMAKAGQDAEYQQALQRLKEVEAAYLALLETLSCSQRETLERYITACEEMDEALVFVAYQFGLQTQGAPKAAH